MDTSDDQARCRSPTLKVAMTQPAPVPAPPPGDPAPAPTSPPTPAPAPPVDPPADQPLGPAGQKALAAEREARKELEKKLAALSPLQALAEAIGGGQQQPGGKSEVELLNERFAQLEQAARDERAARFRIEVAQAKGLTAEQSAWLQGTTQEELSASADKLLAAFPAPTPAGPRTPAPDPTQGARGPIDIDQQIRDAETKGDVRTSILLKAQKSRMQ
jgi:hypothetical protein